MKLEVQPAGKSLNYFSCDNPPAKRKDRIFPMDTVVAVRRLRWALLNVEGSRLSQVTMKAFGSAGIRSLSLLRSSRVASRKWIKRISGTAWERRSTLYVNPLST